MGAARHATAALAAGLALGILLADVVGPAAISAAALVAVVAVLGAGLARRGRAAEVALLAATFAAGLAIGQWRGAATSLPVGSGTVPALIGGGDLLLVGSVVDDPRPREDRQQLVLDELELPERGGASIRGRVLVWLPRGVPIEAGERLEIQAELTEPRDFDGFAYRDYLARQGIGAVAYAYEARQIEAASGLPAALGGLRDTLLAGLNGIVPEPEAALGAGILLGVRAGMSPELSDAFATAGLTHVVAISGWNIAIVAALVTDRWRGAPAGA
jgi:competence protein ComEC